MALGTQLASITQYWYANKGKPTNLWFRGDPLLGYVAGRKTSSGAMRIEEERIQPQDRAQGGRAVRYLLEYQGAWTGGWGDGAEFGTNKRPVLTHAEFAYGGVSAWNSYGLNEMIQATGPEAVADVVTAYLDNMMFTAQDTLAYNLYHSQAECAANTAFHANTDSAFWLDGGLTTLFDATGTYGGIAYTDLPNITVNGSSKAAWTPANSSSAKTMGFDFIMEGIRTCTVKESKEGKPDLVVTTEALRDSLINTAMTLKRLTENSEALELGYDNVAWAGIPVTASSKQTSSYCDFLNTRYLHLKAHEDYPFTMPEWRSPFNKPDNFTAGTRFMGVFGSSNRAAHARFTSVSAAS